MSTNGLISFGSGNDAYSNQDLTSSGLPVQPAILPYWDDLVVDPARLVGAGLFYETIGTIGSRQFIVEWYARQIADFNNDILFEAILFEGTNDILF